ncbi:MAG: hypothetical protein PF541_02430, partial [Prolixibacteraceae bacterium]|nr:hypothetical protein [Prolixibacteraceae bacterium]
MNLKGILVSSISPVSILACCLIVLINTSCDDFEIIKSDVVQVSNINNKDVYIAPLTLEGSYDGDVLINDEPIVFDDGTYTLHDAGFYTISLNNSDPNQFVLFDEDRMSGTNSSPEWGLKSWTPALPVMADDAGLKFDLIHPQKTIGNIEIPFVLKIEDWSVDCSANVACNVNGQTDFLIKNGIGSTSLNLQNTTSIVTIGNNELKLDLSQNTNKEILLKGDISDERMIEANSIVHITAEVNVLSTGSLIFKEGAIIIVDKGVNVYNSGPISFNGTEKNPILVTCSNSLSYFGGFIAMGSKAEIKASHTFFSRFSYNNGGEFDYGHAHHQALFKSENSQQQFDHCYFFDSPGQVFYTTNSNLQLNAIIV